MGYGNLGRTIPALKGALKGRKSKRKSGGSKMSKTPKPPKPPKTKVWDPQKANSHNSRNLISSPILDHERSKDCDTGGTVVPSDREKGTDSYLARTLVYELLRTSSLLRLYS